MKGIDFVCGHNIIHHDLKFLFGDKTMPWVPVDTLYMSPLLFPEKPYHKLVKDDKLMSEQMNNPVNDCEKARELLADEVAKWHELSERQRAIYTFLLDGIEEFSGFLQFAVEEKLQDTDIAHLIRAEYKDRICDNTPIETLANNHPAALAYALALIDTTDRHSTTPAWVLYNFPETEYVIKVLRNTRCAKGCAYCNRMLDVRANLKNIFGFDNFRTFNGEPLQENAARAAADGKSLLAIFPTGGGKSLTFQLPAFMAGENVHGLTVVISPLQSLMKDQVDNLANRGITDAVTINGLLDPISHSNAIERVLQGEASLLYIAPEMLRSKTIERILLARNVVRFVIDEAHCFSAWGHDFRVDYMYIGKFIKEYQKQKQLKSPLPVSCFTATAKQKVVQDICDYFKSWLGIDLELFASNATRTNLQYRVIHVESDEGKYTRLREIIKEAACPTIVYVSRTKRTHELAESLSRDGMPALPYNGRMDTDEKVHNQDAFMHDRVGIIVATSAFGMGVDKSDVGLVVHYDISDSLENYVQEAGRAGRDPKLNAKCFVLYCDNDLDKHFILLNQTKLSINEIQQVWKAVKEFTRNRPRICCSALEIARQAGWDDSVSDIETRVRTALATLEQSGYIERGNNVPHVYATGITVKNMDEARRRITESPLFSEEEADKAVRIIKSLITRKNTTRPQTAEAESRIDYLADVLGLSKRDVVSAVERMKQDGILADTKDISAYMQENDTTERKTRMLLERFAKLEQYILSNIPDDSLNISYKQLNENATRDGITTSNEKSIRTLLYFLVIKGYAKKKEDSSHNITVKRQTDMETTLSRFNRRLAICRFTIDWLYGIASGTGAMKTDDGAVRFSVTELLKDIKAEGKTLFNDPSELQLEDVEEALLYMSKIGALKLEGGFLVLYNAMEIQRLKDSRLRYKLEDYRMLNEFYKQKIQQIHIVGEYANLMVRDYDAALQYVNDYFHLDYRDFIDKYFNEKRKNEIKQNLTPGKYQQLFGNLSARQKTIIDDNKSRCIVVAAGPGSGKTRVLVHKLASLLLLEDVKHEQLLMLTFSRAAATEFKQRLMQLIGNAAHFVEIKTFHSYCFDLLGRIGNLDDAANVVGEAARRISQNEVEKNRIAKTVLVVDEAQDMSQDDYALVAALIDSNDDMRVIAVGDDDQNIYEFRGSDSKYMFELGRMQGGRIIEMTDNYRSARHIVDAANDFAKSITGRMKKTPINSVADSNGFVAITRHTSCHMYAPLAEDLKKRAQGTTCVLTQTNEEAAIILALLQRQGIDAKLVQSLDGLRFWNLAEMRYFLKHIDSDLHSPTISEKCWNDAKERTFQKYSTSSSLTYVRRCITTFEQTNRTKYRSDFREYVFESSIEDFCDTEGADIIVSTIHKAKGLEFDNVYMYINNPQKYPDDDLRRRYYVAMTRAKHNLHIHTNSTVFDNIRADKITTDTHNYDMPDEIVLQLSHKDVYLDFFKECKNDVLALRGGDALTLRGNYLCTPTTGRAVAKLSKAMQEKLDSWAQKGYLATAASVRFVVAWKPKGTAPNGQSAAVLLAEMTLRRQ